ncbi:hypothetical protein ACO0K2_17930 [Undibacterium sp. MH2W]|uniref:hypothetical protein n=1 Tax=Undibacterium sp. MH2W TaxID=3413044 RepID=UPI003BEFF2BC
MSVTHQDFDKFSQSVSSSNAEFDWRNACSRSYYGAYHLALSYAHICPDQNFNFKMGSHERLSERFKSHKSIKARSIATMLECMKKYRHMADYEIADGFDRNFVLEQNATYKRLVQKLDELAQSESQAKAV